MVVEWLTITELAERTNIPETTIRRYVKLFKTFFKTSGGTRSRRYEEQGVRILVRIKNLYDEGRDTDEISRILTTEFAMVIDDNVVEGKQKANTQALPTADDLKQLRESLKYLEAQVKRQEEYQLRQDDFNKALVQKLDQLPQYISNQVISMTRKERIELEQERERARIETAATLNPKKSWWQRLIGK